ncbi:Uncharacterised protein [uncultured archaeon]|nr:Uncharacterised protein [uncultured archaeon]
MRIQCVSNIFALFILYTGCALGVCIPFYDGFEGGINSHNWLNHGWAPDNEEIYAGKHSISSLILGNGTADISITVTGPCNVSFKWKIFPGFDKLVFFDNGNDSNHIPYRSLLMEWDCVDNYSITDNQSHVLKWVHENEKGVGTAWIDEVHIYPILVRFVRTYVFSWISWLSSFGDYRVLFVPMSPAWS